MSKVFVTQIFTALLFVGSMATGHAQVTDAVNDAAIAAASAGTVSSVRATIDLPESDQVSLEAGTYAVFHTSEGDFIAALSEAAAPQTVRNFIAYATGQKAWRHPITLTETTQPLYSNTTIYRAMPKGMIFGGDPTNRGEADSGTQLPLEASSGIGFDQPGLLAMDSSGDMMSGSRWFITLRPFPDRTGKYTVFGKIIGGLDLVQRISTRPVKRPQLPLDPVMVYFIEIVKVPVGRVTSGAFRMENGLKVLRIDPAFKDAPMGAPASDIFARSAPGVTAPAAGAETTATTAADETELPLASIHTTGTLAP